MAEQRESEWSLYYTEEGYPYYYNSVTNESVWAEESGTTTISMSYDSLGHSSQGGKSTSSQYERHIEDNAGDNYDDYQSDAISEDELYFQEYLKSKAGQRAMKAEKKRLQLALERKLKYSQKSTVQAYPNGMFASIGVYLDSLLSSLRAQARNKKTVSERLSYVNGSGDANNMKARTGLATGNERGMRLRRSGGAVGANTDVYVNSTSLVVDAEAGGVCGGIYSASGWQKKEARGNGNTSSRRPRSTSSSIGSYDISDFEVDSVSSVSSDDSAVQVLKALEPDKMLPSVFKRVADALKGAVAHLDLSQYSLQSTSTASSSIPAVITRREKAQITQTPSAGDLDLSAFEYARGGEEEQDPAPPGVGKALLRASAAVLCEIYTTLSSSLIYTGRVGYAGFEAGGFKEAFRRLGLGLLDTGVSLLRRLNVAVVSLVEADIKSRAEALARQTQARDKARICTSPNPSTDMVMSQPSHNDEEGNITKIELPNTPLMLLEAIHQTNPQGYKYQSSEGDMSSFHGSADAMLTTTIVSSSSIAAGAGGGGGPRDTETAFGTTTPMRIIHDSINGQSESYLDDICVESVSVVSHTTGRSSDDNNAKA